MEGVVFAAGHGTRLGPITDDRPKALVEVGGAPLLEIVARRLVAAGVDRLVVNLHPFPEMIRKAVRERDGFGIEVVFSEEPGGPLETGGGLKAARPLLRCEAPLILHNVDVLTDLPLETMYDAHEARAPLATLAVMERQTQRYLLFDEHGLLGRVDETKGFDHRVRPAVGDVHRLAFSGVHVVAPAFLDRLEEKGVFSILEPYLRLASEGARILPYRMDGYRWMDVGKPAELSEARRTYREN